MHHHGALRHHHEDEFVFKSMSKTTNVIVGNQDCQSRGSYEWWGPPTVSQSLEKIETSIAKEVYSFETPNL